MSSFKNFAVIVILLTINAFGIYAYLIRDRWITTPPSGEDSFNGFYQITFWTKEELPILVGFFILNLICMIYAKKKAFKKKWIITASMLLLLAWLGAVLLYGMGIVVITKMLLPF